MQLSTLLNLRVALIGTALLLAAIGISNGFVAVFFQARYEVIYRFDVTAQFCTEGQCAFVADLTLANTGRRDQAEVIFAITGLPPELGGSRQILNLSAAEPRTGDPVIEQRQVEGVHRIVLRDLAAGTLVRFAFRGSFPEAQLPGKGGVRVEVQGRGRMIEGDPRALTFGRYII